MAIMLPVKCDARGNLYIRSHQPLRALAAPVSKITRDGKRAAVFTLASAPGFEEGMFGDFAVDIRGKVYLLAMNKKGVAIVAYDSDGGYDSTIKPEGLFGPAQLAVFPSGEFLASGEKLDERLYGTGEPFTAIFDRNGKLIKELSLPQDIWKQPPSDDGTEKVTPSEDGEADEKDAPLPQDAQGETPEGAVSIEKEQFSRALSVGMAVPAEDGNVYLMRATPDPLIYVIAPGGTVLRRLVIARPSEHSDPSTLHVAGGKLVVQFSEYDPTGKFKRSLFAVANAESGETLSYYVTGPEVGGALACYTPNGFTFLGSNVAGQLILITTYPY
ncbi:MAG: hypothetical protein ACE5IP_03755 [Terriglobia bacterium]